MEGQEMAMKPIAVVILVAVFSLAAVVSSARTVTMPAKNPDEQSVNAVAGPPPVRKAANRGKFPAHPTKAALKKSKIQTPPPMHDPN